MSKLQVSDNSLVDIANMTLANQLESRLKELERNIAVARQFIGMADECYSKVKHEWELLQQDIGVKSTTSQPGTFHPRKKEQTSQKPGNLSVFKEDSVDRPASQRISSTLNHFLLPVEKRAICSRFFLGKTVAAQSDTYIHVSARNLDHGSQDVDYIGGGIQCAVPGQGQGRVIYEGYTPAREEEEWGRPLGLC